MRAPTGPNWINEFGAKGPPLRLAGPPASYFDPTLTRLLIVREGVKGPLSADVTLVIHCDGIAATQSPPALVANNPRS